MKKLIHITLACLITAAVFGSETNQVERLICIRHGEKPKGGLGQLSCQGLNRALALPPVLLSRFGKPDYIFAPNPDQKVDDGKSYNYVRPLMTIEPTAVVAGLPVNTEYGFKDLEGLKQEITKEKYRHAVVFIAWEHIFLDQFADKLVLAGGGNTNSVPQWPRDDFDTIFIFDITYSNSIPKVSFHTEQENLNGLGTNYLKPYGLGSSYLRP